MEIRAWKDSSRYGAIRLFEWSKDKQYITITCYDTLCYSCTNCKDKIIAINPDGGPYFGVGSVISHQKQSFIITSIVSYTKQKNILTILVKVI
jgi:hypothetical protein